MIKTATQTKKFKNEAFFIANRQDTNIHEKLVANFNKNVVYPFSDVWTKGKKKVTVKK